MPAGHYRSNLARLRALPELFTLTQLGATLNSPTASTYVARWRDQGLIAPFGKTGLYFNLLANPQSPRERAMQALTLLFPSAVIISASVLHDAGWTTQIPRTVQVAVSVRPSYPQLEDFTLLPRRRTWYTEMHPYMIRTGQATPPRLSAAAALVDGWRSLEPGRLTRRESPGWAPDPDDLDLDEVDWPQVQAIAQALSVTPPDWACDFMQAGLFEDLAPRPLGKRVLP